MLKRMLLLLVLSCFTLSGCVPVIVVAGATAGGAIIYDNRSFKQMHIDSVISQQVHLRLNSDPILHQDAHVVTSVYNGVILLAGQTPTPELRTQAYQLVSGIANVSHIYNEITVQPPTSKGRRIKDGWITTKVKSAMLAKQGLKSTNIKVMTENGTVFLMGDVSHHQANIAATVASHVADVKKVVKVFQYPQ